MHFRLSNRYLESKETSHDRLEVGPKSEWRKCRKSERGKAQNRTTVSTELSVWSFWVRCRLRHSTRRLLTSKLSTLASQKKWFIRQEILLSALPTQLLSGFAVQFTFLFIHGFREVQQSQLGWNLRAWRGRRRWIAGVQRLITCSSVHPLPTWLLISRTPINNTPHDSWVIYNFTRGRNVMQLPVIIEWRLQDAARNLFSIIASLSGSSPRVYLVRSS